MLTITLLFGIDWMAGASQNHFGGALGGAGRKRHLNGTSGDACRIASVAAWVLRVRVGSVARHQPVRAHVVEGARRLFANSFLYSIAQTPEGYLWLGTEAGFLRFDGMRAVSWPRPTAQELPSKKQRDSITRSSNSPVHHTSAGRLQKLYFSPN